MNDPKNRDEVTQILMETGGVSPTVAAEIFAPYLDPSKNVLPRKGELDMAAFNRVIKLMAEVGAIPSPAPPAETFVDLQYLQAAGIQ
jgi:hypothetical protein